MSLVVWLGSGAAITAVTIFALKLWSDYQKFKSLRSFPSPKGYWLLGNGPQLIKAAKENTFNSLKADWAKKLGPIYVYWVGNNPTLILSNPKIIKKTIVQAFKHKTLIRNPKQGETWEEILGAPVMIQQEGESWQWRRQTHNKNFHSAYLKDYSQIVSQACEQIIDICKTKASKQETIEVDPLFSELTMRIICRLVLGITLDDKNNSIEGPPLEPKKLKEALSILTNQFITKVIEKGKWMQYLPNFSQRKFNDARQYLQDFIEPRVDFALKIAREGKQADILGVSPLFETSILVQLAKQFKFTKEMLCAETISLIFAGTDPTAHTLSFTVGAIGLNPGVFQKARDEVDRFFQLNVNITFDNLKELSYIKAIVREGMRLYPVTNGGSGYIVETDTVIEGVNVPKGTEIGWSIMAAGRDVEEYPHPNEFLPERWMKKTRKNKNDSLPAFLFFGSGPHRCLGESLAFLEAITMLAMLICYFEWEVINGRNSLFHLGQNLNMFPRDLMPIKFTLRILTEQTVVVN
ncbi:MAG: cytochrome P450 [Prochloraceae cyanobacterium]